MESMTIDQFLSLHPVDLTMTLQRTGADGRKYYEGLMKTIAGGTFTFVFPFSCGSLAGEPDTKTVLECLASDAQIGQDYTLREFLKEFSGKETDMLTDINTYAACQDTMRSLQRLFRDGAYEALLTIEW